MKARVFGGRRGRTASALGALAALCLIVAAFAATGQAKPTAPAKYTIGVSNTLVGNGWREGMICSIKAQARRSGQVSSLRIAHRQTDTAGQIADIRTMISAGVNAIIINPSNANALKPIAAQARARGIRIVFIDQYVNAPGVQRDQRSGRLWAHRGRVAVQEAARPRQRGRDARHRRRAGRHGSAQGLHAGEARYPNIRVVRSVFTGWQFAPGGRQMLDILNSGTKVDGVWTSGIDYTVVNAFRTARKPYVPVVGADNFGFIRQVKARYPRLQAAAVTNPSSIGGVGVTVALRALNGQSVPRWVKLKPDVWTWPADRAKINKFAAPGAAADASAQLQIPPWTTYTLRQYRACQGP